MRQESPPINPSFRLTCPCQNTETYHFYPLPMDDKILATIAYRGLNGQSLKPAKAPDLHGTQDQKEPRMHTAQRTRSTGTWAQILALCTATILMSSCGADEGSTGSPIATLSADHGVVFDTGEVVKDGSGFSVDLLAHGAPQRQLSGIFFGL